MPLGPAALGHDPVVLENQRRKVLDTVEKSGVVKFRDDPLLPFLPDGPNE
jgi:hypothetical protein